VGISALFSFLISQVLFSVLIMDLMSRITERRITGDVREPDMPLLKLFLFLLKQEIPRSVVPILISVVILIAGWFMALGPIVTLLSSAFAVAFLAWDNTDLLPARRMAPFKERFGSFTKSLLFHLGFGLPFLIPGLNLLFLSFAPVGATLYHLEGDESAKKKTA
jgi:CysZ protein